MEHVQVENEINSPPLIVSRCNSNSSEDDSLLTLEDLEVIKTIGEGSFGRVVLVQDMNTREFGALKILSLFDLIKLKQVDHVKNEKSILRRVNHPFIVGLKWHYKDEFNIYMLFDYVCGGELFSYLRSAGHFSSLTSSFYAAEIVSALEYLHSKSIVYRDLKPENLLLDKEGHLKIIDFGFAKEVVDRTWTLCGTPQYLAPEIIQGLGQNKSVDWWALGVLIFEMLCGYPPFFDDKYLSKYERILAGKVDWPDKFTDSIAKDLVKRLLTVDSDSRLGNLKNGVDDVKNHKWFQIYRWHDVYHRRIRPPIIPEVTSEGDSNNFDDYPDSWKMIRISETQQDLFSDF